MKGRTYLLFKMSEILFITSIFITFNVKTIVRFLKIIYFPFYFLLSISRDSIILGSNFLNGDFNGFTHFEVS